MEAVFSGPIRLGQYDLSMLGLTIGARADERGDAGGPRRRGIVAEFLDVAVFAMVEIKKDVVSETHTAETG